MEAQKKSNSSQANQAKQAQEDPGREIFTFSSRENEQIKGTVRKYKGKYYFDLRVWFQPEDSTVYYPTKKGLYLYLEHLEPLRKGLDKIAKVTEKVKVKAEEDDLIEV